MTERTLNMVKSYVQTHIDNALEEREKLLRGILKDNSQERINALILAQLEIEEGEEVLGRINDEALKEVETVEKMKQVKLEEAVPFEEAVAPAADPEEKPVRKTLTDEDRNTIRKLVKAGYTTPEIQKKTGISYYLVRKVMGQMK